MHAGALARQAPRTDNYGDPLPDGALVRLGTECFRCGYGVSFLAYSADGKTIAFGGSGNIENAVRIADAQTGKVRKTIELKRREMPERVAFSSDGKQMAVAWRNVYEIAQGAVVVWDLVTDKELRRIDCGGAASGLTFSPDGKVLVTVDAEWRLHVWDAATGKKLHDVKADGGRISNPIFSADGKMLAFSSFHAGNIGRPMQHRVFLYDTADWSKLREVGDPNEQFCHLLAFSPDGKLLAGGDHNGGIYFWDADTGKLIERQMLPHAGITSLSFSHDGKVLAVAGNRRTIWDVATRKKLHDSGLFDSTYVVAFSPKSIDPMVLATNGPRGPAVRFWNPLTDKEIPKYPDAHSDIVQFTRFLPGGKVLSVAYFEKGFRLWDAATGKQLAKVTTGDKDIAATVASADGKLLAVTPYRGFPTDDNSIRLFDLALGKEIQKLKPGSGGASPIGFSPDRKTLLTSELGVDGELAANSKTWARIAYWDATTGKVTRRQDLKHTEGYPGRAALSDDGKTLVLQMIVTLPPPKPDPSDKDPARTRAGDGLLPHHRRPDDRQRALENPCPSRGRDRRADVLPRRQDSRNRLARRHHTPRRRQRRILRSLDTSTKDVRHWGRLAGAIAFTPDSERIISTDDHTNVFIWDVATGKELRNSAPTAAASARLACLPTARRLPRPVKIQRSCCGGWRNHDGAIHAPSALA